MSPSLPQNVKPNVHNSFSLYTIMLEPRFNILQICNPTLCQIKMKFELRVGGIVVG